MKKKILKYITTLTSLLTVGCLASPYIQISKNDASNKAKEILIGQENKQFKKVDMFTVEYNLEHSISKINKVEYEHDYSQISGSKKEKAIEYLYIFGTSYIYFYQLFDGIDTITSFYKATDGKSYRNVYDKETFSNFDYDSYFQDAFTSNPLSIGFLGNDLLHYLAGDITSEELIKYYTDDTVFKSIGTKEKYAYSNNDQILICDISGYVSNPVDKEFNVDGTFSLHNEYQYNLIKTTTFSYYHVKTLHEYSEAEDGMLTSNVYYTSNFLFYAPKEKDYIYTPHFSSSSFWNKYLYMTLGFVK